MSGASMPVAAEAPVAAAAKMRWLATPSSAAWL